MEKYRSLLLNDTEIWAASRKKKKENGKNVRKRLCEHRAVPMPACLENVQYFIKSAFLKEPGPTAFN